MKLLLALLCLCATARAQVVGVLFYNGCEASLQDSIFQQLSQKIRGRVVLLKSRPLPSKLERRDSGYDAVSLTHATLKLKPDSVDRIIAVTSAAIMAPRNATQNWGLFGYSMHPDGVAVVSTRLFKGQKVISRTVKVALHELAHTYGADHCYSEGCIMNVGNGYITELDQRKGLCQRCAK